MTRFDLFIRTHRWACVCWEVCRWLKHKILFFIPSGKPVWYGFDKYPPTLRRDTRPIDKTWYRINRPLYLHEKVYYNLDNALRINRKVKGFAFVFFMGIGDYLYTTPVLAALKAKYPRRPFYGYVGAKFDRNNSPLVGKLLEQNPHFSKVFYFEGMRHPLIWKNYDYSDALKNVPDGFLVIPIYYEYGVEVTHRVASLFQTFGLPCPQEMPVPQMYFPTSISSAVAEYLATATTNAQSTKGIVFLQLDSRGSNYVYPHVEELALGLIEAGYFVMSVTPGGPVGNPKYLEIDIQKLSINETWQLLDLLKKEFTLRVIAVNSVFWAASAGLHLPNLGLQHWVDKKVHNLWYPNIDVVTNNLYPFLPRKRQIYAPQRSYTYHNNKIIDYKPSFVIRWFKETFERESV